MALVSMTEVLSAAERNNTAVAAFNVSNIETAQIILDSATEFDSSVILSYHASESIILTAEPFLNALKMMAQQAKIPVVLHFDHGNSFSKIVWAIQKGFTSVMIDGSLLPYDENVELTAKVVEVAHSVGVCVEGELGCIRGEEGGVLVLRDDLTDPEFARDFVEKTGVDSLAVAIGTAHGLYQGKPRIDLNRLEDIRSLVNTPLVLHGGSGIPDATIVQTIEHGIRKINISTEYKVAYRNAVREFLNTSTSYELSEINAFGMESAREIIRHKIKLFQGV